MSTDVEPAEGAEVEQGDAAAAEAAFEEGVQEQLAVEKSLWHAMAVSTIIAVPVCVVIWVAIVALAVAGNSDVSWGLWIAIGVIVGVLAGVFFGGLFTFVTKSHVLDEADRHAAAAKHGHAAGH